MALLMANHRTGLRHWARTVDRPVLIAVLALIGVGLLLSLAAGPIAADRLDYDNRLHFVIRHAVFAGTSVIVLLVMSLPDPAWARRVAAIVFAAAFLLMAVILVFGYEAKGSHRWIRFAGFSLQPSEFVKPALIVLTGWLLAQRQLFPEGPWAPVALTLFVSTLGLLLLQPDVGQAALLTMAFVCTFIIAGLPLRWVFVFAGGGGLIGGLLYFTMPHVQHRVNTFFSDGSEAFQVERALAAQARGGVLGAGPGEGTIKRSIPDGHNDFIYSIMVEEFGLVMGLALISVFVFITLRGLMLASRIDDPFRRAAGAGLFALFGLQAAINLMVNVNLIPPKGMTLPFVSHGGSSMLGCALTLGLALALVRQLPRRRRGFRYG